MTKQTTVVVIGSLRVKMVQPFFSNVVEHLYLYLREVLFIYNAKKVFKNYLVGIQARP